jgi:hypothetical protein
MKIRSDSPFAALTEEDQNFILEMAESSTMEQLALEVSKNYPEIDFSTAALKRFVRRMREENLRGEIEESDEAMESFAKAGKSGRSRDGVMEAMRRKMYAEALEAKDSMRATMVFRMMKEERKEDRTLALEERRMALEEENAKQEWRRQELEDARSALKLLPKLAEILMGGEGTDAERVARAREILGSGGPRLLVQSVGE